MSDVKETFVTFLHDLQERICKRVEELDGEARFCRDAWQRPGGGGGLTRALGGGRVFERAGVSVSVVHGELSERMNEKLGGGGREFTAQGLSLILHPRSPMVPIVHLNVRYLEKAGDAWFGGGADLTPCYLEEDDARHFHGVLRRACERFEPGAYARFKAECDAYFHIRHRGEARGVGGVFFDYLRGQPERTMQLAIDVGEAFLEAYPPIVERRRDAPYGERERRWQLLRRGRYVEFNLVYDRGTLFGLETAGRTESLLVSMPPLVAWEYGHEPEPGSREAELLEVLRRPRAWA